MAGLEHRNVKDAAWENLEGCLTPWCAPQASTATSILMKYGAGQVMIWA